MSTKTNLLWDPDLERAIVAEAVFNFPSFLALGLSRDDFAVAACQAVFDACHAAWEEGGVVNADTVALALTRRGTIHMVDGPVGLAHMLVQSVAPDPDRLRELRRLRRLQEQLKRALMTCERGALDDALTLAGEAHEHGLAAANDSDDILDASQLAELVLTSLSAEDTSNIHPGLQPLLDAVGKLAPGSVLVVAADTNVGKSSLCLEQAIASAELGQPAGLISVEDPNVITGERTLGAFAGVSPLKLRRRDITHEDWRRIGVAVDKLSTLRKHFFVTNKTGGTELDVAAAMTRMAQKGAKLIVVDYIGTIRSSKQHQDRRTEVSYVLNRLKAHASRLGIALVLVSQLKRPDKTGSEPGKHDLKESGDLENSAEVIVVMWRKEEDDYAPVHCKVVKSKVGGNGTSWVMQRNRTTSRFQLVDPRDVGKW